MAISKIILNGVTQMDVTNITATEADVAQGKTFLLADGTIGTGTGSGGGGSSAQIATGTVTGSGSNILQIPCNFAPDLIYVYGDLSGDASLRGVVSFTIIKDTYLETTIDSSTSNTNEFIYENRHSITGYRNDDTSIPYGEYANGTVLLDMVTNSSSTRFNSGVTYSYKFVKWTA